MDLNGCADGVNTEPTMMMMPVSPASMGSFSVNVVQFCSLTLFLNI